MRNMILRASQERNGNMSGSSPIWNVAILASFRESSILASGWQEAKNMDSCYIQGSTKRQSPDFVNFVIALAYHSTSLQHSRNRLAEPCSICERKSDDG